MQIAPVQHSLSEKLAKIRHKAERVPITHYDFVQDEFICHDLSTCVSAARRYFVCQGTLGILCLWQGIFASVMGDGVSVRHAITRSAFILALCGGLAACAQAPSLQMPGLGGSDLNAAPAGNAGGLGEMQYLGHQTFAGKVLTAIALERVTGLKPDPSRFSDLP